MNDPQDTQDGLDALRERVEQHIAQLPEDAVDVDDETMLYPLDSVLVALGLNDLDAVAERMAAAMYEHNFGEPYVSTPFDDERAGPPIRYARELLEAALTPPEDEA